MAKLPTVKTGAPIRAADHNRQLMLLNQLAGIQGARWTNVSRMPGGMSISTSAPLRARVRGIVALGENATETAIQQYGVVCVSGQSVEDSDGARQIALSLSDFETEADLPKMVVALEDIEPGAMGRVLVSGVCLAIATGSGPYASPAIGWRGLSLGETGYASVLAVQSSALALIRFPDASPGAASPGDGSSRAWIDFGWAQ